MLYEDAVAQRRRSLLALCVSIVVCVVWIAMVLTASANFAKHADLASRVSVPNIMIHLNAFEAIAAQYNNSRSIANGFNASAEYVISTLKDRTKHLDVWTQPFVAITYTELSPPSLSQVFPDDSANPITFLLNTDFRQPRYGGNGTYSLTNVRVGIVSGNGCSSDDYAVTNNAVALVANNDACDMYTKAALAEDAGALGVMVWSNSLLNTRVRIVEWKEGDRVIQLPVLSVTRTVYDVLTSTTPSYVNMSTQSVVETHHTFNVFAETVGGNPESLVFPGAHLDSVSAGPGAKRERERGREF